MPRLMAKSQLQSGGQACPVSTTARHRAASQRCDGFPGPSKPGWRAANGCMSISRMTSAGSIWRLADSGPQTRGLSPSRGAPRPPATRQSSAHAPNREMRFLSAGASGCRHFLGHSI